jgi:ABC-2 type transport system permease protein
VTRKDLKKQNLFQLLIVVANVFIVCYISSIFFFRIDLTQEKRYTLSEVSKQILKSLPDQILIKVYLEGDLPKGFKQLNKATREMLDEFRIYGGKNIQYQFIDPYENPEPKVVSNLVRDLYNKGIQPTNIKLKDSKGGYSEKQVLPGALVSYNGVELPLNLLSNNTGLSGEENLNNSIESLEYTLLNTIHNISNTKAGKIAFLKGHGELDQYSTADITRELANYYQVDTGEILSNFHALDPYKCVIIAGPEKPFSEEDKFVIDQYLMHGGKLLWFLNPAKVDADSIAQGRTMAYIKQLNIDDQLFKYGIRINPAIIQDVQCALIPINTSMSGTQPKFIPVPWLYLPLLSGSQLSPISRNLNLIKADYCSFIDTLVSNGLLEKTVILNSSKYSRIVQVPSIISLSEIKIQHQRSEFDKSFLPVAVLVEGKFPSVFKNRMLSGLHINGSYKFLDLSVPTKMLVVADGNIIRNEVRNSQQGILITPLGFDRYTSQTFGNKDFVLNAVNYMTDEIGIMKLRSRQITLRLLDKELIRDDKLKWQLINVLLPVIIIILAGIGFNFWRKRIYTV